MLQITSPASLAKLRYRAKKRGLRILRDGTGNFSVISVQTEPPPPLVGLDHVPLWPIASPSDRRSRLISRATLRKILRSNGGR